jgi:predicted aspartyl protease
MGSKEISQLNGRLVLPVKFCRSDNTELTIDFVVDTGFNDRLTLYL